MSTIEANVVINLSDGVDPSDYIDLIKNTLTDITGRNTEIHVTEVDNPLTTNTIGPR